MKTITILFAGFLAIGTQNVFADSMDQTANCCPVIEQISAATVQSQQLLLDQLQAESETMQAHSVKTVHEQAQKKVALESDLHAAMTDMQHETESIPVEALQAISAKAAAFVKGVTYNSSK